MTNFKDSDRISVYVKLKILESCLVILTPTATEIFDHTRFRSCKCTEHLYNDQILD